MLDDLEALDADKDGAEPRKRAAQSRQSTNLSAAAAAASTHMGIVIIHTLGDSLHMRSRARYIVQPCSRSCAVTCQLSPSP